MGTYRLARPLPASSLLLDSSVGVSDAGQAVLVYRFKEPWSQVPGFLDRFAATVRGWQALKDTEGVVGLVEAGQAGQSPCVVVEYAEAETLRTALRGAASAGRSAFSPVESLALVLQAARGLLALERLNPTVVHGDVCASSLWLGADGSVRLDAIGIAAATPADPAQGPARAELLTLAPEEVTGERTGRTDVFRLGLVWLELLTGKPAFVGASYAEVKSRFENFPGVTPAHFPSLPPPVAAALAAMLSRAPSARPSPSDLELMLTQAFESLGGTFPSQLLGPAFARVFPARPSVLASLPPSGGVTLTVSGPSVKLGRIGTKKVTADDVAAAREAEAAEAARALARDWSQRHARDDNNPKDFALGATLLELQKVPVAPLDEALAHAQSMGGTLFEALCLSGAVEEDDALPIAAGLLKQAYLTGKQLLELPLGAAQAGFLARDVAEEWNALPLKLEAGGLTVAVVDPSRLDILEDLKRRAKARAVTGVRATDRTIREGLARVYDGKTSPPSWTRTPAPAAPAALELAMDLSPRAAAPAPTPFAPSSSDLSAEYGLAFATPPPQPNPSAPAPGSSPARPPTPSRPSAPAPQLPPSPFAAALSTPPASAPQLPPSPFSAALSTPPASAPRPSAPGGASVPTAVPPRASPQPSAAPSAPRPPPAEPMPAPPPSAPRTATALAGSLDVALRLFDALLALSGERGLEGAAMSTLVRSVAKQAGASGAPLDQVRLSVAAVVAAALLEGKHAYEVPSRPATAMCLGPHWPDFEDFVRPLLDGGALPTDPRGVVLCLCFEVATAAGRVPKTLADARDVLDTLRGRYPAAALASLEIVLASNG